jgi:hypothetical protein
MEYDKDGHLILEKYSDGSYLAVEIVDVDNSALSLSNLHSKTSSTQEKTQTFTYYEKNFFGQSVLVAKTEIRVVYITGLNGKLVNMYGAAWAYNGCILSWNPAYTYASDFQMELGLNLNFQFKQAEIGYISSYFSLTSHVEIGQY